MVVATRRPAPGNGTPPHQLVDPTLLQRRPATAHRARAAHTQLWNMETELILSTLECKLLPLQTSPCSGNWPQYPATKSPTLSSMCSGWMSCKARLGVTASWPRLHGSSAHVFVLKLAQDAVYRGWLFLGVSRSGWRGLGWWGHWHETREC